MRRLLLIVSESEIMTAKMKGLDSCKSTDNTAGTTLVGETMSNNNNVIKDVNSLQNNQMKISSGGGNRAIPPDQMKCNILKAKAIHDDIKRGDTFSS